MQFIQQKGTGVKTCSESPFVFLYGARSHGAALGKCAQQSKMESKYGRYLHPTAHMGAPFPTLARVGRTRCRGKPQGPRSIGNVLRGNAIRVLRCQREMRSRRNELSRAYRMRT